MLECLAVGIGGFIGAVSRYLMGLIIIKDTTFPFMTMMINIIGAFVIGLVVALASKYNLESRWILFLKTGGMWRLYNIFNFFTRKYESA